MENLNHELAHSIPARDSSCSSCSMLFFLPKWPFEVLSREWSSTMENLNHELAHSVPTRNSSCSSCSMLFFPPKWSFEAISGEWSSTMENLNHELAHSIPAHDSSFSSCSMLFFPPKWSFGALSGGSSCSMGNARPPCCFNNNRGVVKQQGGRSASPKSFRWESQATTSISLQEYERICVVPSNHFRGKMIRSCGDSVEASTLDPPVGQELLPEEFPLGIVGDNINIVAI